jgi:cytochrome c peroxidase
MAADRSLATIWKAAALTGALALGVSVAGAVFGAVPAGRQAIWQQYRRPAAIPFPAVNPYSDAKLKLGRMLFFDPVLSGSRTRSCATCHNPGLSWTDGQPRAIGENDQVLPLRTPTLLDVAWIPKLGWDGHFRDLESVAMGPITAATNMNLPEDALIERLRAIAPYGAAFDRAFGEGEITGHKIELALATFERSIVSDQAPFDRWIEGDQTGFRLRGLAALESSGARPGSA